MIAIKYTGMDQIPGYCDDCLYYECRPHPYKGYSEACALTMEKMDDDAPEGWIYDGNGRPKNCPLIDARENVRGRWVPGKETAKEMCGSVVVSIHYDGWYCSECGYRFEGQPLWNFCPNCGADMRKEA